MMTAFEFIHAELKRLHGMLDKAIGDLTPAQLHAVPANHPKANTLAWIFWHYARTEDNVVRFVLQNRRPTVWAEGGYAEKLRCFGTTRKRCGPAPRTSSRRRTRRRSTSSSP